MTVLFFELERAEEEEAVVPPLETFSAAQTVIEGLVNAREEKR
jgi:hypothetical protein